MQEKEKDDLLFDRDMALEQLEEARAVVRLLQATGAGAAAGWSDPHAAAGAAASPLPAARGPAPHALCPSAGDEAAHRTHGAAVVAAGAHQHHPALAMHQPHLQLTSPPCALPPVLRNDPALLLPGRDPELGFEAVELAYAVRAFGEQVLETVSCVCVVKLGRLCAGALTCVNS